MKLLIDGDILCYNASERAETSVCWGDDHWSRFGDIQEGAQYIDAWIHSKQVDLGGDQVLILFSRKGPKGYFRNEIFPSYKAHRATKQKPFLFPLLRQYCQEAYKTQEEPRLEADDLMGLLSEPGGTTCIVSSDKDMLTIPGYVCGMEDDDAPQFVSQEEADFNWLYQTLIGDGTDGYPGCSKVGPVTARKLLDGSADWGKVLEIFSTYMTSEPDIEAYALTQARMARILRPGEYDFNKKEVKLWSPTKQLSKS